MNIKKLLTPENFSDSKLLECEICMGSGAVIDADNGEHLLIPCENCDGTGSIEFDEPSFELPLYKIYEKVD